MDLIRVYLAGGMDGDDWQAKVTTKLDGFNFNFYNPRLHKLQNPMEYTTWDLHYLRKSDIVFAYMENNNPSGYGLTLEVGYAYGLGKTIIIVDEKSGQDSFFEKKFAIVKELANAHFDSFDAGLQFLESFKINK